MTKKFLVIVLTVLALILAFAPIGECAPPPHPVMEGVPPIYFTNASGTAYYLVTPALGLPIAPASGASFNMSVSNPASFPSSVTVVNFASFPTQMMIVNPASFSEVPTSFAPVTVNPAVPGFVTTPAGCKKVALQITSSGKQAWYKMGANAVSVHGPGSELLTWAAEIDCGPGVDIAYIGSESASLTIRIGIK